jgi:hypothetical protein
LAIEFDYLYTGSSWGFSSTYEVLDTGAITGTTCGTINTLPCNTGLWMGGAAPAADGNQNVYLATGNDVNYPSSFGQYSNSVLKLTEGGGMLVDYYSPPDYLVLNHPQAGGQFVACGNPSSYCPTTIRSHPQCTQNAQGDCKFQLSVDDWDLGSGGVVLLASGGLNLSYPEMVASGKQGMVYVLFSGGMGGVDPKANQSDFYACSVVTSPPVALTGPAGAAQCFQGFFLNSGSDSGGRGSPAFVGGGVSGSNNYNYLYAAGVGDTLNAYQLTKNSNGVGVFGTPAAASNSTLTVLFGYPGASPSVTWDGSNFSSTAIVWALDTSRYAMETTTTSTTAGPAALYAFQANPSNGVLTYLWQSGSGYSSTNAGAVKFVVPTIVDGYIFMAGGAKQYSPGTSNCPVPTATTQPTACGGLGMYKHQ